MGEKCQITSWSPAGSPAGPDTKVLCQKDPCSEDCQLKLDLACAVPAISSGVESWSKPYCNSAYVLPGTTCNITAKAGFTCTSPGLCDEGMFENTGACDIAGADPTVATDPMVESN